MKYALHPWRRTLFSVPAAIIFIVAGAICQSCDSSTSGGGGSGGDGEHVAKPEPGAAAYDAGQAAHDAKDYAAAYDAGQAAFDAKDYAVAVKRWHEAASEGNGQAMYDAPAKSRIHEFEPLEFGLRARNSNAPHDSPARCWGEEAA